MCSCATLLFSGFCINEEDDESESLKLFSRAKLRHAVNC
jgi:hypothetical protein